MSKAWESFELNVIQKVFHLNHDVFRECSALTALFDISNISTYYLRYAALLTEESIHYFKVMKIWRKTDLPRMYHTVTQACSVDNMKTSTTTTALFMFIGMLQTTDNFHLMFHIPEIECQQMANSRDKK